ncbi:MAG: NAD-dependent epimerase/dehydratase family protein [Alphaproteobacteria bacterium]|nr:NAD-dependent epimerase/dehydratase family protein [Alphaproteobacteria bacterium]
MKILVLGGDGYLGWPTAMHFAASGDEVWIADNFAKRQWELEDGIEPLLPTPTLHRRVQCWNASGSGSEIRMKVGDLINHRFVYNLFREVQPDTIVHYAEQPSAPYSMQSRAAAVMTQHNNVIGNLNLLFAMQRHCPDAHLIKLGTMGEYGTPNIDIEEGWLDLEHNGRKDRLLYPKKAGSFYHLSKVHDSHNIEFACRIWGIRATDLNQGVVYGIETDQTVLQDELRTSFHYDHVFGTVLNRFLVQAVRGLPLTIYGKGGQTRGFLNIRDTLACVELAARNPGQSGEFRVFNQFTEQFTVTQLAEKMVAAGTRAGLAVTIDHLDNPRVELEEHYYNAKNTALTGLGLQPNLLTDGVMDNMLATVRRHVDLVNPDIITPQIRWAGGEVSET